MKILGASYLGFLLIASAFLGACASSVVADYTAENIQLDSTNNSTELEAIITPYRQEVDAQMNTVIGTCKEALIKYTPESPLGNFSTDAVWVKALGMTPAGMEQLTVDNSMVLLNFGGLRAPINKGEITVGNVFELMPFDNTVAIVALNKSGVEQMKTYLYTKGGQPVANAQLELSAESKSLQINGKEFVGDQLYIVTSNYLASGGDKMTFLRDAEKKWDSGILIRDLFIEYIKVQKVLEPGEIGNRLIIH